MKSISYILVGLTFFAGLCASCSGNKKGKDGRTDTYSSGAISFVSDESFSPIIEEERNVFQFDYPQAKVTPVYTNESDAIKVAYDALAFIVNTSNKDSVISVQDIKNVMNGTAKRWKDISNGSSNGIITVVFDNAKSSTVHYVEDSILGGKPITNPNVAAVNKTSEVIKYVEENPGAIGVIGNNWLNDQHDSTNLTFKKNIRVMRVSKVHPATLASSRLPYQYYIYNGEYPLVRTIYALLNDPRQGLPWGFAHFIEGPKGQRIVMKAGLLPVLGDINVRDVNVSE